MNYIALVGNPNTGKTTFFNNATNSHSHIGNWHGVTIEPESKQKQFSNEIVIDLAGTYSLNPFSFEESITTKFLLQYNVDIFNICEQNNLTRNLMLTLQLLELNYNVKLVINTFGHLVLYDKNKLQTLLGCQVEYVDFYQRQEVLSISTKFLTMKTDICDYLNKLPLTEMTNILNKYDCDLSKINSNEMTNPTKCNHCQKKNNCFKNNYTYNSKQTIDKFVIIRYIEGNDDLLKHYNLTQNDIKKLNDYKENIKINIYEERYKKINYILNFCKIKSNVKEKQQIEKQKNKFKQPKEKTNSKKIQTLIDKILLNKYFSIPIFLSIILLIFFLTFSSVGVFFSDILERALNFVLEPFNNYLKQTHSVFAYSLFIGITSGVGAILTFLPQVLLLFLFLTILEESGYMARLAYQLEGLCHKIGLSGKSVFTFLMGFGCTATALMTAENLDNKQVKLKTVLCTPFMSCSAKLPVFAVLGGTFFGSLNVFLIFFLYVLSIIIGIVIVNILDKTIIPNKHSSFILEFPPYRIPKLKILIKSSFTNTKQFLKKVASYILLFSIVIWFLQSFDFKLKFVEQSGCKSIMQTMAEILAPIFAPLGFGEWGAVSALLAGIVAKELIVSTIGILNYVSIGNDLTFSLMNSTSAVSFTNLSVISFLVFCLLYTPCIATLSSMKSQIGTKWTIFSFCMQFLIAYLASLVVYTIGLLIT